MSRRRENYTPITAEDRAQWKTERLTQIGQLITNNTKDAILEGGIVLEHIDGSCYKVWANSQELYASHNKSKNLWAIWH